MTGSVAANFHEGSRSEVIADYLLSSWGTVTPVRRQDDHGVDLYCTLTARTGQRATVTDYYGVQVKSTSEPVVFGTSDSVRWLVENPNPIFLARVDKSKGELILYQILCRFLIAIQQLPDSLELTTIDSSEGHCPSGLDDLKALSLSAPILRFTLQDSLDDVKMDLYLNILRDWVRIDRHNCNLRTAGVLRFRMPHQYSTNVRPKSVWVEFGNLVPDELQMARAVDTFAETLDCVGHQLFAQGDRKSALYAAVLLKHLRGSHASGFAAGSRWELGKLTGLESEVRAEFNRGHRPQEPAWREPIEIVDAAVSELPGMPDYFR